MELSRAYLILEAQPSDSPEMIRRRYHQMMQLYHPDTAGDDPASVFLSQQINEAYAILKAHHAGRSEGVFAGKTPEGGPAYAQSDAQENVRHSGGGGRSGAGVNAQAYCERNLYEGSGTYDSGQNLWHQTGRGKVNWDPDHEDFRIFIRSINEACSELLSAQERRFGLYDREDLEDPSVEDEARLQLFHLLIQQFIRPAWCLERIAQEHERDPEIPGKFCFEAAVGLKGEAQLRLLEHIRPGDLLGLELSGARITVSTREGLPLGHLSFHEDSLYYITALLLREGGAVMEPQVKSVHEHRAGRSKGARIVIRLHILLDGSVAERSTAQQNRQIEAILMQYRRTLSAAYGR